MSMPTLDELRSAGEVFVTWGFWAIVYGLVTMSIGLGIIIAINVIGNKPVKFFK